MLHIWRVALNRGLTVVQYFIALYPSSLHLHSHTHLPRQFLQQYNHYQSLLQLFLINPSQQSSRLEELLMFLSQVTRNLYKLQFTDYQISSPLIQTVIHTLIICLFTTQQVWCCYPDDTTGFPAELQSLLRKHAPILDPDVLLTLRRGLILMKNKSFIAPQRSEDCTLSNIVILLE